MARHADAHGYDAVWVGDSIVAKPRVEPLTKDSRIAILKDGRRLPLSALAHDLEGFSAAQIRSVVDEAALAALEAGQPIRADHLRATPAAVRFLSLEPLLGPLPSLDLTGIDWVIVGGESGPGARPMHLDWARDIRDRCVAARVPFFFKQWGEWMPLAGHREHLDLPARQREWRQVDGAAVVRVGKKAAGRELDGRTWDQMPEAVTRG